MIDLITAKEARQIADVTTENEIATQLINIMDRIKKESNDGYYYATFYEINEININKLEELGYDVNYDDDIQVYFVEWGE